MRYAYLALVVFAGCFSPPFVSNEAANFETFVAHAYMNGTSDNIVKTVVMEWTPDLVYALADERARKERWSSDEREEYALALIKEHYGVGDSTTFLIDLTNTQFPCQSPILVTAGGMKPLIPQSMMPCADIPIDDIHNRVWIENERGTRLRPLFVTRPRNLTLTTEEWIFAKFQTGITGYNWKSRAKELTFVIDIKPEQIRLKMR